MEISGTLLSTLIFFVLAGGMVALYLNMRRHIRGIALPDEVEKSAVESGEDPIAK